MSRRWSKSLLSNGGISSKRKKQMVEANSDIDNIEPRNRSRKPKQSSEGGRRR